MNNTVNHTDESQTVRFIFHLMLLVSLPLIRQLHGGAFAPKSLKRYNVKKVPSYVAEPLLRDTFYQWWIC
jgi:hypothetical protein